MRTRWMAGLSGLAVAALGLSACSSSSTAAAHPPPGTPHDVLLASPTKTVATSAHMTLALSLSGSPTFGLGGSSSSTGQTLSGTISASADFDFATKSGDMTLTVPPVGGSPGGSMQFRVVGQTIYLEIPALSSATGGKPWVKLDLTSYQSALGTRSANPFGGLSSGDPTQLLQMLDKIGAKVTEVGPADTGGVPTTEYRATIDLTSLVGQAAGQGSGVSAQEAQQFAQRLGLGSIPVTVWVDDQGRARQVQLSFSVIGIHLGLTMGFSDFGESVLVAPPPPDQVADGSSLLQGGQLSQALKSLTNLGG